MSSVMGSPLARACPSFVTAGLFSSAKAAFVAAKPDLAPTRNPFCRIRPVAIFAPAPLKKPQPPKKMRGSVPSSIPNFTAPGTLASSHMVRRSLTLPISPQRPSTVATRLPRIGLDTYWRGRSRTRPAVDRAYIPAWAPEANAFETPAVMPSRTPLPSPRIASSERRASSARLRTPWKRRSRFGVFVALGGMA